MSSNLHKCIKEKGLISNEIINENCLVALPLIPDNSIDCCVTSPPYNIGIKYNTYKDNRGDYLDLMQSVFVETARVIKPTGHFFLNVSPTRIDPLLPYRLAELVPMVVQNPIVWVKSLEIDGYVRGHGQVCRTNRYLSRGWEVVWHFTHEGKTPIDRECSSVPYVPKWAESNSKRSGRTSRLTSDCWFIPYETVGCWGQDSKKIKGDKKHPAVFPRDLVRKCISITGLKWGVVLDPFAGTGTVGVVAKEMGLDSICIEIDSDYCEFITNRMIINNKGEVKWQKENQCLNQNHIETKSICDE